MFDQNILGEFQEQLRDKIIWLSHVDNKLTIQVSDDDLRDVLTWLKNHEAVLLTMAGTDERIVNGKFGVYSVFNILRTQIVIEVRILIPAEKIAYPSVTSVFPSAHWLEREIKDMLGVTPLNHPDLRKLAVHPDWPEQIYPLRKDFIAGTKVPRVKGEFDFCKVEGEGIYQIPVGPIHAGIIEPGHFRFFTFGEEVIDLQAQLFYTHRGIEKKAEGKNYQDVSMIAERICGVCSVSHAVSYAQSIEALTEVNVPLRAKYFRTIFLELERLYNHVGDLGNMCAGIGFALGISRGAILKEKIMRKNMELTGHRYLRGTVLPGGVKKDFCDPNFLHWLKEIKEEIMGLKEMILASAGVLDRMQTTGILSYKDAETLGAVGPAARASGVDRDLRRDLPYAAYSKLSFRVLLQKDGDVYCRFIQRAEESLETIGLLQQAFLSLPEGELSVKIEELPPYKTGLGWTESARGANVHWIMSGENNTIYRYMVRSASHCNWPVVPLCLPGNIVPDFPLINKSFELCYACLDR